MTLRFLRGEDDEFSYGEVDGNEGLDEVEMREAEESWIEGESPGWVEEGEGAEKEGETGVQDF